MEYAKRKIHFASPEVAHVQQIYSAEPSEIAIMEENHHELQQKESDIFTHQKLGADFEIESYDFCPADRLLHTILFFPLIIRFSR